LTGGLDGSWVLETAGETLGRLVWSMYDQFTVPMDDDFRRIVFPRISLKLRTEAPICTEELA
jgi:hypothetical protein